MRRVYAALLLSGLAALVHEVMWVRLLGQIFGHTIFAVQTVLTVFFGGIALGAFAVSRMRIVRPLAAFAWIELGIAAWGALLPLLLAPATRIYDAAAPLDTETPGALAARLAITFALLIVPATLMGATFPIVAAATQRVAAVYAVNTLGGAAGVWLTAFVVLPSIGVRATIAVAVAMNVIAALLARNARVEAAEATGDEHTSGELAHAPLLLFATGLTALGLELLWTRALEQILSGTIYTFATVLAVYLAGIALGSVVASRTPASRSRLSIVLALLGGAVVLTPSIVPLLERLHRSGVVRGAAAESIVAAALLLIPTTLMGMTFPLLLRLGRGSIARLTAANTAGSLLGPIVAGFVLLPRLGLAPTIVILGLATAVLAVAVAPRRAPALAFVAVLVLAAIPLARPLRIVGDGESLIAYRDDTAATVAVVARGDEQRLKVNNSYSLGGGRGVFTERRQGHLPMFLHAHPRRVLVLGIGTGNTLGAVSLHEPEKVVAVDLLPGVVDLAARHFASTNENVLRAGDAEVLVADATRIVRSSRDTFDLVIGDLFHPWQAGVGGLYSREHFTSVRERLGARGVFVQWLPLYQLSTDDLRTVTRTFLGVFPHAQAWLGNFGASTPIVALVGSNAPIALHVDRWERAMREPHLRAKLGEVYLDQRVELEASFVCGRELLASFAGAGPLNTNDRPRIEYTAARAFFRGGSEREKRASLMELVKLAAAQDRADRARGAHDARWFDNRLGIRAFIVTFVALEERNWREAARGAVIAAEKCTGYDLPRRSLAAIGFELLAADRAVAADVFRAALRWNPHDQRAREGLAAARGLTRPRVND